MLSKEEVADVISYCKEHGCSYKEHLAELGIPEWKFYDSKYKYAIRERKEFDKGRFLQLRTGSDGSMTPFASFDSAKICGKCMLILAKNELCYNWRKFVKN